jgi:hypothetical protein
MNDNFKRTWKEEVVAQSRNYRGIFLRGLRIITRHLRIASVLTEIRTKHLLSNTSP